MSLVYSAPESSDAVFRLEQQGIGVPSKPEYDIPLLPVELTDESDEGLMLLFSKLTAYADFVSVQVSCAQVDERALEKRLSAMEAEKMLSSGGKTENRVTFARAQVATDPDVVSLKEQIERVHAYRKLIESMAGNIERDAALVSRELTRRTSSSSLRSSRWSA